MANSQHRLTTIFELKDRITDRLSRAREALQKTRTQTEKTQKQFEKFQKQTEKNTNSYKKFSDSTRSSNENLIGSFTRLAGAIGAVSLASSFLKSTLGGAMRLEQEQIAMEHFIGLKNPLNAKDLATEYMGYLRQNAAETPFSTEEVLSMGRRALSVTEGDIPKAKDLLGIAEDMAALNPNKTLEQAMEAIADAYVGEFERMKEFGFKITDEQAKAAGGGDRVKGGQKLIYTQVAQRFEGGSEKLNETAYGQWTEATGTLSDGMATMGVEALQKAKPELEAFNKWLKGDEFKQFLESGSEALAKLMEITIKVTKFFIEHWPTIWSVVKTVGVALTTAFASSKVATLVRWIKAAGGLKNILMLLRGPVGLITLAVTQLFMAWDNNFGGIREKTEEFGQICKDIFEQTVDGFWNLVGELSVAWGTISGFWDRITSFFTGDKKSVTVNVKEDKKKGNKHAGGLNYVPYDGYEAILHKGERVETAYNARKSRGNITIAKLADSIVVREEQDIERIADRLAHKILEAGEAGGAFSG